MPHRADAIPVRPLPLLGSTLALAVAVGGALLHPELLEGGSSAPAPGVEKAANATTGTAADRQTVIAGTDPVTGRSTVPTYTFDSSLLGQPVTPGAPSVQLPSLVLNEPGPGRTGSIGTRTRTQQLGRTSQWQAREPVLGPVRRLTQTVAEGGYAVVPAEAGELHLLCGPGSASYYVDSRGGEWRVYRTDGGPRYDVGYRFVQYDRSPLAASTACQ